MLGNPKGKFIIDDSDVLRARASIVAAARDINSAFNYGGAGVKGFSNDIKVAREAGDQFSKTTLGNISKGLTEVYNSTKLISGISALLVAGGTAVAASNKSLLLSYKAILGSQQEADAQLKQVRQTADDLKLPFLELAQGGRGFLTVLQTSNVTMKDLLSTSAKLRALAPDKSTAEATFSLREFLTGDIRSIAEQFNLGRKAVGDINREANGDAGKALAGLTALLDKIGITDKALKELGDSGINAFANAKDAVLEAASTAFTPFLNGVVIPLADGFTKLVNGIRETNPGLLTMGAGLLIAAAAFAPIIAGINGTIQAYKTLKILSATNLGQDITHGIGTVVKGALVVEGGIQAGLGVARGLAAAGVRSGDLGRIAGGEDAGAILNQRVAQLISLIVGGLSEAFNVAKAFVKNGFERIGLIIETGGNLLKLAFGNLTMAMASLLERVANLLPEGLAGPVHQMASDNALQGLLLTTEAQNFLTKNRELLGSPIITDAELKRIEKQANIDMLNAFNLIAGAFGQGTIQIEQEVAGDVPKIKGYFNDILDAFLKGTISADWQKIKDKITENIKKISEDIIDRATDTSRNNFDFGRQRERAIADQNKSQVRAGQEELRREQEQINAIAKIDTDAAREEAKARQKVHDEEVADLKEHQKKLLDLQRKAHWDLFDAIAAGDETAAQKALRTLQDSVKVENETYDEKEKKRRDDLAAELIDMEERRSERHQEAVDQLEQMRENYDRQWHERDDDFRLQLAREDDDRALRAAREQEDFDLKLFRLKIANDAEISQMLNKLAVESGITSSFLTLASNMFAGIREGFYQATGGMLARVNELGTSLGSVASNIGSFFGNLLNPLTHPNTSNGFSSYTSPAPNTVYNGGGFMQYSSPAPTTIFAPGSQGGFSQYMSPAPTVNYQAGYNQAQSSLASFYANYNAGGGHATPTPFADEGITRRGGLAMLHPWEKVSKVEPADRVPLSSADRSSGGIRMTNYIDARGSKMSKEEWSDTIKEVVAPMIVDSQIQLLTFDAEFETAEG